MFVCFWRFVKNKKGACLHLSKGSQGVGLHLATSCGGLKFDA